MASSWLQHVNVKVHARVAALDLAPAIDVFHRWIQNEYGDHLLFDVADYRHVPAGPGVILVAHEAIYGLDESGHQLGLHYNRRTEEQGEPQRVISAALQQALAACVQLEAEPEFEGTLAFNGGVVEVSVNDRSVAANDDAAAARMLAELSPVLQRAFGDGYQVDRLGERRDRLGFVSRAAQELSASVVLQRLGA